MYSPEIPPDQSTEPSHGFTTGSIQAVMLRGFVCQSSSSWLKVSSSHGELRMAAAALFALLYPSLHPLVPLSVVTG